MAEYRHSAHAIWDIKYHLVWITKYRYKVLRGEVAERARDLIRQICQAREVIIIRGAVSPDHIHMLVSSPAHLAPAVVFYAAALGFLAWALIEGEWTFTAPPAQAAKIGSRSFEDHHRLDRIRHREI